VLIMLHLGNFYLAWLLSSEDHPLPNQNKPFYASFSEADKTKSKILYT